MEAEEAEIRYTGGQVLGAGMLGARCWGPGTGGRDAGGRVLGAGMLVQAVRLCASAGDKSQWV